ncbi:MAG: hypothetical protein CVU05_05010 [Bacteroidetes bacterium HGW-Bacteroidetes-21]|nr:MAG: hypothetical protein CVU05_05010 [Bacteroidetes bacterium HGW-Bacteroidetes-21]
MSKKPAFLKMIPNILTGMNLCCGVVAVILAFEGFYHIAAWLIIAAAVFDFLDGFAARAFKAISAFGKQFDSLSDLISFGMAPAIILYGILKGALIIDELKPEETEIITLLILFLPVLIVLSSAIRLGIFNTAENQTKEFRGIPTPANALFIASLPLILAYQPTLTAMFLIINVKTIVAVIILQSILMILPFRVLSFKFSNFNFKENIFRYILIVFVLIAIPYKGFVAIPAVYLLYVLLSVIYGLTHKMKEKA